MKAQGRIAFLAMPERAFDAYIALDLKTKANAKSALKALPGFSFFEKTQLLHMRFFKANLATLAAILDPFIVGDKKLADLVPTEPLVFSGPIFDLDFTKVLQKEPTPEQVGMTNVERFADEYGKALVKCIQKNPDEYMYGVDHIPEMVVKLVPSLAKGEASLGPASKAAARACGIKPTLGAIKSFLNS